MNKSSLDKRAKGRRINYLRRVIDVQCLVKEYGKHGRGYSQRWIYENLVNIPGSGFHISYCTFNNYLSVQSPQRELNELLNDEDN